MAKTKFMQRFFILAACTVACLSIAVGNAYASEYEKTVMTKTQVNEKFAEFVDKYDEGDILSEEDAQFVSRYENGDITILEPLMSGSFNRSGSQYGTSVNYWGTVWHNGVITYNFGGNVGATVTSGATPRSMTAIVTCQSFGAIAGGYVIVYEGSVDHTVTYSRNLNMNKSANYTGLAAVQYVTARLDVVTSGGQAFTVQGI